MSLVHGQQKRAGLVFPFVIIPPSSLSLTHTHTHTHTPRKASLTRRIRTVPGSLPKCHQNLLYIFNEDYGASLVAQRLKHLPAIWETRVRSLDREDPLEKEMATRSSILAWRIPWMVEPGRLQSTGSQRVGHD